MPTRLNPLCARARTQFYRNTEPSHLSTMPPEVLARIQAFLNPRDCQALFCVNRRLSGASNPAAVASIRFESKRSATLREIRELLALNPGFFSSQPLELDLSRNGITDSELKEIIERFPNIIKIDLAESREITDDGLQPLALLRRLAILDLLGCYQITNNGLQHLAPLTGLISLRLAWCHQITDDGLQHLIPLTNVATLDLADCHKITNGGLRYLALLTKLVTLDLAGCEEITNDGLPHLIPLTNLANLNVAGCEEITDDGLRHLPNFPTLNLEGYEQDQR